MTRWLGMTGWLGSVLALTGLTLQRATSRSCLMSMWHATWLTSELTPATHSSNSTPSGAAIWFVRSLAKIIDICIEVVCHLICGYNRTSATAADYVASEWEIMPKSNAGKVYNKCTPSPPPSPSPSPSPQHLPHNLTTALSVRAAIRKRSEKCCPCFTLTATFLPFLPTLSLSLCLPLLLLLILFCKCLNNAATFGIYMRIAAAHRRRKKKQLSTIWA